MKRIFGYTLTEVLVSIVVIGVLASVTIPMIMDVIPNKNAIMIKKAYYTVENIVKLLINDSYYYPDMKGNCFDGDSNVITSTTPAQNCYLGFDYAENLPLKIKASDGTITKGASFEPYKFIYLFISYLDTVRPFESEYLNQTSNNPFMFVETTDGMVFNFVGPQGLKDLINVSSSSGLLYIDVNGRSGPNSYAEHYNDNDNDGKTKCSSYAAWKPDKTAGKFDNRRFDRFVVQINKDGSIEIPYKQTEVMEIINSNKRDNLK